MIRFNAINFTRNLNLRSLKRSGAISKTNTDRGLIISDPQTYNNLLCLQEDYTQYQHDIAFVQKNGEDIIKELERLRMGVLENTVTSDNVDRLKKILEVDIGLVESTELAVLLTHIMLRAEVELAKIIHL